MDGETRCLSVSFSRVALVSRHIYICSHLSGVVLLRSPTCSCQIRTPRRRFRRHRQGARTTMGRRHSRGKTSLRESCPGRPRTVGFPSVASYCMPYVPEFSPFHHTHTHTHTYSVANQRAESGEEPLSKKRRTKVSFRRDSPFFLLTPFFHVHTGFNWRLVSGKKAADEPKKPSSAWILFSKSKRPRVSAEVKAANKSRDQKGGDRSISSSLLPVLHVRCRSLSLSLSSLHHTSFLRRFRLAFRIGQTFRKSGDVSVPCGRKLRKTVRGGSILGAFFDAVV